jgi:hypothetical protein
MLVIVIISTKNKTLKRVAIKIKEVLFKRVWFSKSVEIE